MTTANKIIDSNSFEIFKLADMDSELIAQFITSPISAGFPSPANDYQEEQIDLKKLLFKNPINTYVLRAKGNSMQDIYINPNDLIIVDTSIEPLNNDICVCVVDGDYTLKRISKSADKLYLMPYNKDLKPIEVTIDNRFSIWGVLTYSIHKHNRRV
jgi:DNA polymerase V